MKISIGCDHRGFHLKKKVIETFTSATAYPLSWNDVGTHSLERTDYPFFAQKLCKSIIEKETSFGILICGSGLGMVMAANRFKNIYAALCWNESIARMAYEDDGANVLVLTAD